MGIDLGIFKHAVVRVWRIRDPAASDIDEVETMINISEALAEYRGGKAVVFVCDGEAQGSGYLALAAQKATERSVGFLIEHGTGYLGLALTPERMEALQLPQVPFDISNTPFSLSNGGPAPGPGVPRAEMAQVIRNLADPGQGPEGVDIPQRIVPLRAMRGGVLACASPVEASVDMARLCGLGAVSAVCGISPGQGARRFAAEHGLSVIDIPSLIAYRRSKTNGHLICLPDPVRMPTRFGEFRAQVYEDPLTGVHHMAVLLGDVTDGRPVLTRMHSECLTGDVLGSLRCDCGPQLEAALERIAANGRGVLVYLRQEGRGIGLYHKLQTYALQERGLDTVEANQHLGFPADLRDYGIAGQILGHLGVRRVNLLTNNPRKIESLEEYGVEVAERVPLVVGSSTENQVYLRTKERKLGHMLGSKQTVDP